MSNANCPNCGASQIDGAKFCRQCGWLVGGTTGASGVTEATTRTLPRPAEYAAAPTEFIPSQPTGPAYISPAAMPPPPAYNTRNLEERRPPRNTWLLTGAVVAVLLGMLIALGIVFLVKSQSPTTPQPPTGTVPSVPPPPLPPQGPGPSNAPTDTNVISRDYFYPGAENVMEMRSGEGVNMVQLRTKDSYQKVLDWYTAKLKPGNEIISPGPSAVLKSDKLMVVINGAGVETHIILKKLDEAEMEINPGQ